MKYLLCGINAKYIHSNLAIYCLRAFAVQHGPRTASFVLKEYTINHYVDDILQDIYEEKADVIIFSCYIWNISYVRELAEELKKVSPETAIWVGGPEVSYEVEEFLLENPSVDLVMQGEGEETFTALVSRMEEKNGREYISNHEAAAGGKQPASGNLGMQLSWEGIPGVAWCRNGQFFDNGTAALMDLDRVPFVYEDFHLFEHKIIYYETSRGCPFSCSYCLSSVDKRVRFRSPEKVLPELQRFLDAGVPQVKFVDRTFNCSKKHAMVIWSYIQEKDNGVTNFHFEISADLLDGEALDLFQKMRPGLIQLEIGVQSTNPATIDAISRHMDLERLFENVDKIHRMGNIHQHMDLIAGLPLEGYDRFKVSFNELYAHKPDQLQLGFLKVLKGTCMKKEKERYGLVYRSQPPYEVLQTCCMSYDEVIRMKGVEEMVEIYYNSGQYSSVLCYVVPLFAGAFDFFEQFSLEYRRRDCHKMNHNRMDRYRILRDFLRGQNLSLPFLDELMLLDMYLRENIKSRPAWAADLSPYQKEIKEMYKSRGGELFPKQWQEGTYVSKKATGHSHVEIFSFDVERFLRDGILEEKECWCLFDYSMRNPLNKNARVKTFQP